MARIAAFAPVDREQRLSTVLSDFVATLLTDVPIQGILDVLVERIVAVLPVTSAGVTLVWPDAAAGCRAASDSAARGHQLLQSSLRQGPCVEAAATGQPVAVPDVRAGDARFPLFCPLAAEAGLAAVFTFPLRHRGSRLGALDLYRDTPGPLPPQDTSAAQTIADVVSAYLLNAHARDVARNSSEQLRDSALHDALTGLPNRLLLEQRLDQAARRSHGSRPAAAVLFADLNGFKAVNDTHGHAIGDALLIAVAGRLAGLVRPGDTLARVSGDEFVVLCEDLTAREEAEVLAERLRSAFSVGFSVSDGAGPPIVVSIGASIGAAFAAGPADITATLVSDADAAMYVDKRRQQSGHLGPAGEGPVQRRAVRQEQPAAALPGLLSLAGGQPSVVLTAGGF